MTALDNQRRKTMSKRYQACVRVELLVDFIDDGTSDLKDQAIEAAQAMIARVEGDPVDGMEIIGQIDSYKAEAA